VTGAAGFIGSHLVERLLKLRQRVVGLDNLATGKLSNLEEVRGRVPEESWGRFSFRQGSVADADACRSAMEGAEIVLHQAGFVSVPLSLQDPLGCHETNVTGTINLLLAARELGVQRFVFASSSAVYGDEPHQPNREDRIGRPLSPYGASKRMGEMYASQASLHFGLQCVGLRYFNVFGPRQDPAGGYAAVIPQWISAHLRGEPCTIHGDGANTRDFCPVANIVQANLLAGFTDSARLGSPVYNVALGGATSLLQLQRLIAGPDSPARHGPARAGDIVHSSADVTRISADLGYAPEVDVATGLAEAKAWYAA
jgi:UDP-N-acetylglucosamine 4-epimerase